MFLVSAEALDREFFPNPSAQARRIRRIGEMDVHTNGAAGRKQPCPIKVDEEGCHVRDGSRYPSILLCKDAIKGWRNWKSRRRKRASNRSARPTNDARDRNDSGPGRSSGNRICIDCQEIQPDDGCRSEYCQPKFRLNQ